MDKNKKIECDYEQAEKKFKEQETNYYKLINETQNLESELNKK